MKIAVFDMDGTAVNTIDDVLDCFNGALKFYGFPPHSKESFSRLVGGDLETIVSGLIPQGNRTRENIDNVKTLYRKLYLESDKPNTRAYDGIIELMQELKSKGVKVAINTNKGQALLDGMLDKVFPAGLIDSAVGYLETRPSKPDPYGVNLICKECGCDVKDAVYIGDGMTDIKTAANCNIPVVLALWGQCTKEALDDPHVNFKAQDAAELREILLNLL